jgi:hypothetical protein
MPSEHDDRTKPEYEPDDPYESTTRWMVDSGRRRSAAARPLPQQPSEPSRRMPRPRSLFGISREVYLFAVLVAVYLNYYFMQVTTEIQSLSSLVFFVSPVGSG